MVLLAAALAGCAAPSQGTTYVHPNADLSAYRRVAILPLENLSGDRFAAERMRELLAIELSALGAFEVVELGEVNRVLRLKNIQRVVEISPEMIADLGATMGVTGLLLGSVLEYRERRSGSFTVPEVALSLRLLDVETGIVAWSVTDARSGISIWTRLFGVGESSQTRTAGELIRTIVQDVYAMGGS